MFPRLIPNIKWIQVFRRCWLYVELAGGLYVVVSGCVKVFLMNCFNVLILFDFMLELRSLSFVRV